MYLGGSDSTEWEDITGSTHMSVVKGCVSFTSAVSARSVTAQSDGIQKLLQES